MSRKLAVSAVLIATSIGLLASTAPALAQTRDADIRFEAAQRRFDGELAMFKAEVERYERARMAAPPALAPPQASPVVPRDDEPRGTNDDAVRNLDEPGANTSAPPRVRDEDENQPPQ